MIGSKKRVVQFWGRELDIVKQGLSQSQVYNLINELVNENKTLARKSEQLTFLERLAEQTVTEADKLAVSIRNKAQEEATNILQTAEKAAAEVKTAAVEETKQLLTKSRERLENALRRKADEVYRLIIGRVEGTIAEVWSAELEPEVSVAPTQQQASIPELGEEIEEPAAQQQASIPELGEEMKEPAAEEPIPISYEGKVDLNIVPPVDLAQFMKLRKELRHIPQLKILQITSSQKKGSRISTLLTEPIPLLDVLNVMPEVRDAVAENRAGATIAPESRQIEHIETILIKLVPAEKT